MAEAFIGTSGWVYRDWVGIFYPRELPSRERLRYFSLHFRTTEVNYSFYHLPRAETYNDWYNQTDKDFVFSVKASRFITHVSKLKDVEDAWERFFQGALNLKNKLGPILFQFPPSFRADAEHVKRLEGFLEIINLRKHRFSFEFRHVSWCDPGIYKLLKRYGNAWVISDSSRYPKAEVVTADFVYVRMHGPESLFSPKYTYDALVGLASKIRNWLEEGLDVYVYFNNDFHGYALENARELLKLLGRKR